MRRLLTVACLLTLAATARADYAFTLRDYLGQTWRNELVTYTLDPAQVRGLTRLVDPYGQVVPVQIQERAGKVEVSFLVRELPADGALTYRLTPGAPVGRSLVTPAPGQPDALILDSRRAAALVLAPGERRFPAGTPLSEAPAPLLQVRGSAGQWLGQGRLAGSFPVISVRSRVVASGPIYAETRTDYELADGGRYSMTVRVVSGQEAILVSEDLDTPREAIGEAFFQFSLREGLEPQRMAIRGRLWRERQDRRQTPAGDDYALEFDVDRREVSVIGYANWWPETVRRLTLHGGPTAEALSFFPTRIGQWRNPMGTYLETRTDGSLYLAFPLYVDQTWAEDGVRWGNPYYTGRLEPGWPRTALRRNWALVLSPESEAVPATGRSAVADAILKYSDLPLDKIKDWVFSWDWRAVEYPRLYVDPQRLPEIRERARTIPGWDAQLGRYYTRPLTYILTQDPQVGGELLYAPLNRPEEFAVVGALPALRHYVRQLFDGWGYVGFPSPNNAGPMIELIRYDAAMSVEQATPQDREEMSCLIAFVAHMIFDPDWHAVGTGFHLGNPNMPPRQEHYLGMASRLLPTHPLAPDWQARSVAEQERVLEDMVRPSGAWRENPHYQFEAAMYPMMQAAVPLRLQGTYDVFSHPRLKLTMDYLINLLTPPSPRFAAGGKKLRVLPAFGNGSWEFMPLTGWLAALAASSDPEFSRHMMWAWQEQGSPHWFEMSQLVLDPSLPAEQPDLRTALFEGFGAVLRSGFPSEDETWLAFHHGDCIEHYNYGDQGSFMLYARGAPLILHFGSQYTPYFQGAWHFNRACFNRRPVHPDEPNADWLRSYGLDPQNYSYGTEAWKDEDLSSYLMHTRGFFSGEAADYVRGEQVQTAQSLIGKDHRYSLPPNTEMPALDIPETRWNRRILLLKDPDPLAPNYYLIRDDFTSQGEGFPGEWNIWTLAENVELEGNRARVTSRYGVLLDIFMAEPLQPQWSTRQDTNTFLAGPSRQYLVETEWQEVLTNLCAQQAPGRGFLAVLYPRKLDEPAASLESLADGKGVKVTTTRGTDWAFLSHEPVEWSAEGLSFSGTAGAIRQVGDTWTVVFLEPGTATVHGRTLTADRPQEVTLTP